MTTSERIEPVSWLRLERYHLGELSPEEAARVERAIAADAATAECMDRIREPLQWSPHPELDAARSRPKRAAWKRATWTASAWATGIAAAAALAIYVAARPTVVTDGMPPARLHTKGGDVAIQLVRQRDGLITMHPESFASGDAFKVLLTCPPSMSGSFDVVVFQGREASRPLTPIGAISCGNGVPLPGAFSLTGEKRAVVCVVWGEAAQGGASADRAGPMAVHGAGVCESVGPDR